MQPKFEFYEVVKVCSQDSRYAEINGKLAAVLGMAEDAGGLWYYAITPLDAEDGWDVEESVLEPTGRFMKREDFYDGEVLHVSVDPETGEGKIRE